MLNTSMIYATGISVLATCVIGSIVIARLIKSRVISGEKLSRKQLRAYVKANNSNRHKIMKGLILLEVFMGIVLLVIVLVLPLRAAVLGPWLRTIIQPNSNFFILSPGFYALMIASLMPLLITCLAITGSFNLLLPRRYITDYQALSADTPRGDMLSYIQVALIAWIIAIPFITLSLHDYRVVTDESVISNSFFSLSDHTTPLSEIQSMRVQCMVEYYKGNAEISPHISLQTSKSTIVLWGGADERLPSQLVSADDIKQLYSTMREHQVRIDIEHNAACERQARLMDVNDAEQYWALFSSQAKTR